MVLERHGRVLSKQHSARLCKTRWRKPLIKHQINEHAGDGNVKPNRHRPFGDPAMLVPAALKNRNQGENDQPAEMKMVLTKLSVALIAGKSEREITLKR